MKNTTVFDKDINPILEAASNDDLETLVEYLKTKLSEMLTVHEVYKIHEPAHSIYADLIAKEVRDMGGNSFANLFRGEGPSYHEIVCDVASKIKAPYNKERDIEHIENAILETILTKALDEMSDKDKETLMKEMGEKGGFSKGGITTAAFIAIFRAGGFYSYQLTLIIANQIARLILGKGLMLATNAALMRTASLLTGPIGLAITALWDIFKGIKADGEAFERLLADEAIRDTFYKCLSTYSKILSIALSTDKFIRNTDEEKLKMYRGDLNRFTNLRASVKLRYAEIIDYRDYEPKIKKLLDTHIKANEILQLNEPVNIFDTDSFEDVKQGRGIHTKSSVAAKADTIAYATKRVISEKMEEAPVLFEKFSKLIQEAIDAFKQQRISDIEYLNRVSEIRDDVILRRHDDMPESIREHDEACAYYGVIYPYFVEHELSQDLCEEYAAKTALTVQNLIATHLKVDFWTDEDAKKHVVNAIEDFLYDEVKKNFNIPLTFNQMDKILEKTMDIATNRQLS